jgi:hypothetical protein
MSAPCRLCVALLLGAGASSASGRDDVGVWVARHTAAVEAIETLTLKFSIDQSGELDNRKVRGEYWRDRRNERIRWSEKPNRISDVYIFPDRYVSVSRGAGSKDGKGLLSSVIDTNTGGMFVGAAPWRDALCSLNGPGGRDTLAAFLARFPPGVLTVEGPRGTITALNGGVVVTIDSSKQSLISKLVNRHRVPNPNGPSPEVVITEVVEEFKPAAGGRLFPARVVRTSAVDGREKKQRDVVAFTEVAINTPLPPGVFRVIYDGPTTVRDKVQGKEYVVDATGVPTGPAKDLVLPTMAQVGEPGQETAPTATEPARWGWWIVPASASVILAAVAVRLIARRNRRAES